MLEMDSVWGDLNGPVPEQGVLARIRGDLKSTFLAMQAVVGGVAADGAIVVRSNRMGCIAHFPVQVTSPKGRHAVFMTLRIGDNHIQFDFIEWVRMDLRRTESPLRREVLNAKTSRPGRQAFL